MVADLDLQTTPAFFEKSHDSFRVVKKKLLGQGVDLVHLSQMVGLMAIYHPFGRICFISYLK